MVRFRVGEIEIPESEVSAVLHTFFADPVPAVVPVPARPAVLLAPPVKAPRRGPAKRPQPAPAKPVAVRGGIAQALLDALPGKLEDVAARAGVTKKQDTDNLGLLRRKGRATNQDGVWVVTGGTPCPSAPAGTVKSLQDLIRERLLTGPAAESELLEYAAKRGRQVQDRFQVAKILERLESAGEVIGGNGGRWTMARRPQV